MEITIHHISPYKLRTNKRRRFHRPPMSRHAQRHTTKTAPLEGAVKSGMVIKRGRFPAGPTKQRSKCHFFIRARRCAFLRSFSSYNHATASEPSSSRHFPAQPPARTEPRPPCAWQQKKRHSCRSQEGYHTLEHTTKTAPAQGLSCRT